MIADAPKPSRWIAPLAVLAAVALSSGCSGSVEISAGKSVDKAVVEQQISDQLEAQVGQKPDKIECPDDLKAKVGETMRCTLTAGGDELGVSVEVTSVDGSDVGFDINVDGASESPGESPSAG
jgi:hypothetical protein